MYPVFAQDFRLPAPGVCVGLSPAFSPAVLKGIKLDPNNPFRFHFFVDGGDSNLSRVELKSESSKLIKYFLASLTIPEKDLWVNLSPYEKDRIVPPEFGQTEMGRDLLAEDYLLKQITASLIYPESQLGKEFWQKVYAQAQAKYGTVNIPINTFNKVWIVPEKAVVYENKGVAFVLENHLKVMLEQDYLALSKNECRGGSCIRPITGPTQGSNGRIQDPPLRNDVNALGSQIVREIVIPALTKEVNEGKNFAQLRQVFYSLILATWYKKKIKNSLLNKIYSNQNKISGVNVSAGDKDRIYQEYLKAFKKGVYNYIKEESNSITNEVIPRKYFSGGVVGKITPAIEFRSLAMITPKDMAAVSKSLTEIVGDMGMINYTPNPVADGAMSIMHRTKIYRFAYNREKRSYQFIIDKDLKGHMNKNLKDYMNKNTIRIDEEDTAIVRNLGDREILYTQHLQYCAAFILIGKEEDGSYVYILSHIVPTVDAYSERIKLIQDEILKFKLSEVEIYTDILGHKTNQRAKDIFIGEIEKLKYKLSASGIMVHETNLQERLDGANIYIDAKGFTRKEVNNPYPFFEPEEGLKEERVEFGFFRGASLDDRKTPKDKALVTAQASNYIRSNGRKGGIDLNPAQMSMQVKKQGEDFKFDFNGTQIDAAQVTGATFTIRQMTPVVNLSQILGISQVLVDKSNQLTLIE